MRSELILLLLFTFRYAISELLNYTNFYESRKTDSLSSDSEKEI